MTEFDTLTDEELAQLEHLYQSPTWAALRKAAAGVRESMKEYACNCLVQGHEKDAKTVVEQWEGIHGFFELFDMKFDPPKEPEAVETKPRTFHEMMP